MAESRLSKWIYRNRAAIIIAAVILLLAGVTAAVFINAGEDRHDPVECNLRLMEEKAAEAMRLAVDYYRENRNQPDTWWDLVALWGAGVDLQRDDRITPAWQTEAPQTFNQATDYAGYILGLLAMAEPAGNWPENNPAEQLLNKQEDDGSFGTGINNTIWAIISLDCYAMPDFTAERREKALNYLLMQQKNDGGFAYSGDTGDPDMTAMAVHALAACRELPGAAQAIEGALHFFRDQQLSTGGFASFGQENANSTAMVISALTAAGEFPPDADRAASGENKSLLDNLLSFQLPDGAFSFTADNPSADLMATAQALMALGDIVAGETVFARFAKIARLAKSSSINGAEFADDKEKRQNGEQLPGRDDNDGGEGEADIDGDEPENGITGDSGENSGEDSEAGTNGSGSPGRPDESSDTTEPDGGQSRDENETTTPPEEENHINDDRMKITVKVIGRQGTYYDSVITMDKNGITPVTALDAAGLSYETLYGGAYVSQIAGEKEGGAGAGWKYKVNGKEPSGIPASDYNLGDNDILIWWHAENPECTGP